MAIDQRWSANTLILLSSDRQARYVDDIIRVLALPSGAQMQFRYDVRLLQSEVLAAVPAGQLADQECVVCYLTRGGENESRHFIPVRVVRVIRSEIVGSSCILVLEARQYIAGVADLQIRHGVAEQTSGSLPAQPGDGLEGEGLHVFFSALALRPFVTPDLAAFEATARHLSALEPFRSERLGFFAVHRLSKSSARSWFGTQADGLRASQGVFRLWSGKRYDLEVYCYCPEMPPPGLQVTFTGDDAQLQFGSSRIFDVDSRYDIKKVTISREAAALTRLSNLTIDFHRPASLDFEGRAQEITVQMVWRGVWHLAIARAIALATSAAIVAILGGLASAGKVPDSLIVGLAIVAVISGLLSIFIPLRQP